MNLFILVIFSSLNGDIRQEEVAIFYREQDCHIAGMGMSEVLSHNSYGAEFGYDCYPS